jgi:hypothetical protein
MRPLKLIAALLVVSTLGACVGFIVPIPESSSTTETTKPTQGTERR